MSRSVPCAPSNMIDRPAARARARNSEMSVTHGAMRAHARGQVRQHLCGVHRRIANQPVTRVNVVIDGLARARAGSPGRRRVCRAGRSCPRRPGRCRERSFRSCARRAAPRSQIKLAVIRQDEVRLVADDQAIADVTPAAQLVDLREQRVRIDDDAVADDAGDTLVQDARRQQTQHELASVRHTPYGPHCGRPDSARRSRNAASAGRRSCPCLRRPTARRKRLCSYVTVPQYSTFNSMVHLDGNRLTLDQLRAIADDFEPVALDVEAARARGRRTRRRRSTRVGRSAGLRHQHRLRIARGRQDSTRPRSAISSATCCAATPPASPSRCRSARCAP